jgi:hypothetical protein
MFLFCHTCDISTISGLAHHVQARLRHAREGLAGPAALHATRLLGGRREEVITIIIFIIIMTITRCVPALEPGGVYAVSHHCLWLAS